MIKTLLLIMTMATILSIILITEIPSAYAGKESKKEICKENGGKWEDGSCDFKTDDEDVDNENDIIDKILDKPDISPPLSGNSTEMSNKPIILAPNLEDYSFENRVIR